MMQPSRILITGAGGFAGSHLGAALRKELGEGPAILATSKFAGNDLNLGKIEALDVTDELAVADAVSRFQPTHVLHLAGLAAVQSANANPKLAWLVHLFGTLNVANAIRAHAPSCVLINVGTGQVYGGTARLRRALDESAVLAPTNTYETSKAAADLALGAMAGQGLHCIRLRPFNHTGPGQTEDFVVASFAMQIAKIEDGLQEPVLRVGNLDAERDFLDVRDVADAYASCVVKAAEIAPGTIINIASGDPVRIRDLLDRLIKLSAASITVVPDPTRMRPSDTPIYVGDARLARQLLGWKPQRSLDDTLADTLSHARLAVKHSIATRAPRA